MSTDEIIDHQEPQVQQDVVPQVEAENVQQETQEAPMESQEKKEVPLSAVLKERDKRKEAEMNAAYYQQQLEQLQRPQEPEDDSYKYESVTKEELSRSQAEIVRAVDEKQWERENPEKYKEVISNLPKFLKQRPNLKLAIESASNRYEEAYTLMEALSPKQKQQLKAPQQPKREAPNSPTGVPKAAVLNDAVDVMNMSDDDYLQWRKSKKTRR
jgi:hypothetical protein